MNPGLSPFSNEDYSSSAVEILIEESWINRFLSAEKIEIPVNESTLLNNLKINLDENSITIKADFFEKEKSSIVFSAQPNWDPIRQYLRIEDFKFHTKSKNVLLKSKSWFAQLFLTAKLDKKIEEKIHQLYQAQLEKIKKDPVRFPIPKTGNATLSVSDIKIDEIIFIKQAIKVNAVINCMWKLNLTGEEV
jgi:hypothetical protein